MRTIGEIVASKVKQGMVTIDERASVLEAVRCMDRANTGSVMVLDGERLTGIFTERDLMRRVVLKGLDVATTPVATVMTRNLVYTEPDRPGAEAMTKMTQHRCRHLPVVDRGRLAGLVSIGDLMKELSEEQTVEIEFLKQYITSG